MSRNDAVPVAGRLFTAGAVEAFRVRLRRDFRSRVDEAFKLVVPAPKRQGSLSVQSQAITNLWTGVH